MNLLFRVYLSVIFLCLCGSIQAREAVLITYELNKDQAFLVKKILNRDVYLPEQLIQVRYQKRPCEAREASVVQICIKGNKEIEFSHFNHEVVQRSLSVFWEGKI